MNILFPFCNIAAIMNTLLNNTKYAGNCVRNEKKTEWKILIKNIRHSKPLHSYATQGSGVHNQIFNVYNKYSKQFHQKMWEMIHFSAGSLFFTTTSISTSSMHSVSHHQSAQKNVCVPAYSHA